MLRWKFVPDRKWKRVPDRRKKNGTKCYSDPVGTLNLVVDAAIRERYLHPPSRPLFHLERMFQLTGDVAGKNALVFGCGDSNSTVLLALKGAEVWAFDLSYQAIQLQRRMAIANGMQERMHLAVAAAEQLPFADNFFDMVLGSAILHHLPDHIPVVPAELMRILKPEGFAVFSEPVVRNETLGWVTDRLPFHQALSPGERQLRDSDLAHFDPWFHVELFSFDFLSRLDRFVLQGPLEHASWVRKSLVYFFHATDRLILETPHLERLGGTVVMKLSPKAGVQGQ